MNDPIFFLNNETESYQKRCTCRRFAGRCIVARGEETFDHEYGRQLMKNWDIPDEYIARCFVLFGYCDGEYPAAKPRKDGRIRIISGDMEDDK